MFFMDRFDFSYDPPIYDPTSITNFDMIMF